MRDQWSAGWILWVTVALLVAGPSDSVRASQPPDCLPAEFVVFFETGAAELTDTGVKTLGNAVAESRKYRGLLLVTGHTSRAEEKAVGGDLEMQRAKAISSWLSANGVDGKTVWMQDQRATDLLVAANSDDVQNSRAHIKLTKGAACERADRARAEWARQNCLGPVDWIRSAQTCSDVLSDIGRGFR